MEKITFYESQLKMVELSLLKWKSMYYEVLTQNTSL